jgi:hypothetical protein
MMDQRIDSDLQRARWEVPLNYQEDEDQPNRALGWTIAIVVSFALWAGIIAEVGWVAHWIVA